MSIKTPLNNFLTFIILALISFGTKAELSAVGYGATVTEANDNALVALSQSILANVDSEVFSEMQVNNSELNVSGGKKLKVKSHLLLKGVDYQPLPKVEENFQVKATLSKEALMQTVDFLRTETEFDIANLQLSKVVELQEKNKMLIAILFSADNQLSNSRELLTKAEQQKTQLEKRITHAIWKPNFQGKQVLVKINGNIIDIFKPIFLEVGRHDYQVQAEGYRDNEGVIHAKAGELLPITFNWIKKQNRPVQLDISDKLAFITSERWDDILAMAGLEKDNLSPTKLKIHLDNTVTSVDNYQQNSLKLRLSFYQDKTRLKALSLKKNIYSGKDDYGKVQEAIEKMIARALPIISSKTEF